MRLTEFKALTFDCYGTLIDWESGMIAALAALTGRVQKPLSRNDILEAHARHEAMQQRFTPAKAYRDLLAVVRHHEPRRHAPGRLHLHQPGGSRHRASGGVRQLMRRPSWDGTPGWNSESSVR